MAYDVVRMVPRVKVEAQTAGTGTGTLYLEVVASEDKALVIWRSWGNFAPSTTLNAAPSGSEFTRTTAGSVMKYLKTDGTTWAEMGDVT